MHKIDFQQNIQCLDDEVMEIELQQISLPVGWYNIAAELGNHKIRIWDTLLTWSTYTIPDGTYDVYTLLDTLNRLLSESAVSVTYNETTNKYTFTTDNAVYLQTLTSSASRLFGFGIEPVQLGFEGLSITQTLTSTYPISLNSVSDVYLHTSIMKKDGSLDNLAGSVQSSTVFAKVPIASAPFDTQIWKPKTSFYVASPYLDTASFWLTSQDNIALCPAYGWSIVLRVNYYKQVKDDVPLLLEGILEYLQLIWLSKPPKQGAKIIAPEV